MPRKFLYLFASAGLSLTLAGCDAGGGFEEGLSSEEDLDPVVVDFPLVYVARPLPRNDEEEDPELGVRADDVLDPAAFNPGARLVFKARAAGNAPEAVLTDGIFMAQPELDENGEPLPVDEEAPIPQYDVKDVNVSADGTKVVFAMRAPEIPGAAEDEQPTWNIWEYNVEEEILRRIIESDLIAEQGEDISPAYLPNGDIVFSSNRQRRSRALLLDAGKPQFSATTEADREVEAFLLHSMDEEGLEINQLTFNQSHDLQPQMLSNGKVMFMRWDNFDGAGDLDRLSLYTVNPDGSDLTLLYGFHSQNTGTEESEGVFNKAREMADGRILVNLRPRETVNLGGDIVAIDTTNYIDNTQPSFAFSGSTQPSETATAQASVSYLSVITDDSAPSPHGHFSAAFPLYDGTERLITSWSPCLIEGTRLGVYLNTDGVLMNDSGELVDAMGDPLEGDAAPIMPDAETLSALPCSANTLALENTVLSEPRFSLWIYDPLTQTQSPVLIAEANEMYTDVVALEARPEPEFIPGPGFDDETRDLVNSGTAVLHIRSVYDLDGEDITASGIAAMADPAITPATLRPVQFVRFYKAVSQPHPDLFDLDFGLADGIPGNSLKDMLGYAPVHPDGSVMVQVPADVALSFELVDINGRRVDGTLGQAHRNWLTLRPGEVKTCHGCHTSQSTAPHGRLDAEATSANPGAMGGIHFPNTVLLDRFGSPLFEPESGLTMAEYFYQQRLFDFINASDPNPDKSALTLSVDLVFDDVWTDERQGLTKAPSFAYRYGVPDGNGNTLPGELLTTAPVNLTTCLDTWDSLCRVTVSYPEHIQPLWEVERTATVNNEVVDVTCLNCHAATDPDGLPQVPAPGVENQLDLTNAIADPQDDFPIAYMSLFRASPILQLCENGLFIEERRLATDADEFPILRQPALDPDTGAQLFEQENVVIDGEVQYQAIDTATEDDTIIPAPLSIQDDPETTLELVLNDADQPVRFTVNRLNTGDEAEIINYVFEDACEVGREPTIEEIIVEPGAPYPALEDRLDENGDTIAHTIATGNQTTTLLSGNGANASQQFFDAFAENGPHAGYMNGTELKLISEWLDIGGQFYNNPFDTLEDD